MKTTYLIGAGASYGALPILNNLVSEAEKDIDRWRKSLKLKEEFREPIDELTKNTWESPLENFFVDLTNVLRESKPHSTIDTLAKKYWLQNKFEELKKVKRVLSTYFSFKQIENPVNKRYDAFIATLLEKENNEMVLPNNTQILSWNYDLQFELALAPFLNTTKLLDCQEKLRVVPSIAFDKNNYIREEKFSLTKLNGTSGLIKRKEEYETMLDLTGSETSRFLKVIKLYHELSNSEDLDLIFNYSWDNDANMQFLNSSHLYNTETLIVIGYSFPTFNQKIDSYLIKSMPNLTKVVIQDPNAAEIETRIKSFFEIRTVREWKHITSKTAPFEVEYYN